MRPKTKRTPTAAVRASSSSSTSTAAMESASNPNPGAVSVAIAHCSTKPPPTSMSTGVSGSGDVAAASPSVALSEAPNLDRDLGLSPSPKNPTAGIQAKQESGIQGKQAQASGISEKGTPTPTSTAASGSGAGDVAAAASNEASGSGSTPQPQLYFEHFGKDEPGISRTPEDGRFYLEGKEVSLDQYLFKNDTSNPLSQLNLEQLAKHQKYLQEGNGNPFHSAGFREDVHKCANVNYQPNSAAQVEFYQAAAALEYFYSLTEDTSFVNPHPEFRQCCHRHRHRLPQPIKIKVEVDNENEVEVEPSKSPSATATATPMRSPGEGERKAKGGEHPGNPENLDKQQEK